MAKQTTNMRGHDYEMPRTLVSCLIHRSTFEVTCRNCGRVKIANIVDLIQRYGLDFETGWFERNVRCGGCNVRGQLWAFRGCRYHLLPPDEFSTLIVTDGSDWRRPDFMRPSAAVDPPWGW